LTVPGWAVLLPILLPNLLLVAFPARPREPAGVSIDPDDVPRTSRGDVILGVVENVTRIAVPAWPLFLRFTIASPRAWAWSAVAALAVAVYYGAWARFFVRGRKPRLLYQRLGRLPVPLAAAPCVYCAAAAGVAGSPLYAVVVIAFGCAHIRLSLRRGRLSTAVLDDGRRAGR
jgi:hypothetical protein